MKTDDIIRKYNFEHYSDIVKDGKYVRHSNRRFKTNSDGHVYIWVEIDGRKKKIVYVGKAGKRMEARVNQHHGGFRGGSKRGEKHSKEILKGLRKRKFYKVYVRKSEVSNILNESICLCESEEKALINKLDPPWNKIGRNYSRR